MTWFTDWFNDLKEWVYGIWIDFVEFVLDIGIFILELLLAGIQFAISAIPVPAFLQNGIAPLFSAVDPAILYFLDASGIPAALALLGAGLSFRLLRKFITLFQW